VLDVHLPIQKRFFFLWVAALGRVVATDAAFVALTLLPSLTPTTHTRVRFDAIVLVITHAAMIVDNTTVTLPELIGPPLFLGQQQMLPTN
jgi:hypothetical protein